MTQNIPWAEGQQLLCPGGSTCKVHPVADQQWESAGKSPWVSETIDTPVEGDWGQYKINKIELIWTHSVGTVWAKYVKRSTYEYEVVIQTCSHEPLWFTSWGPYDSLERAKRVVGKLRDLDTQRDAL